MRVNEKGRSMIEMLGVLAIVGVLSVGGIAGYSKAMNKFKTNKMIDQVNMIATNIRTLYSSQKTYNGLTNNVAMKIGVIPGEMYDASKVNDTYSTITNAFGGDVKLKAATHVFADDSFIIGIDKIPAASCVSIATTEWGGDSGSGLLAISINAAIDAGMTAISTGTIAKGTAIAVVGDATYGLPFSVVNAGQSCSGDNNAIAWKYL